VGKKDLTQMNANYANERKWAGAERSVEANHRLWLTVVNTLGSEFLDIPMRMI
jgi:hypothetical protein